MKLKYFILILPVALLTVACGSSAEDEGAPSEPAKVSGGVVVNPPTDPNGGGTTTPDPVGNEPEVVDGCPVYPTEDVYYATVSGTGPHKSGTSVSVSSFGGRQIRADSKLRVSIEPISADGVGDTGGSHTFGKMGLRVQLLKNGVVVATKELGKNTESVGSYSVKKGITAGQKSSPALLDFSSALSGSATGYSIRISHVMSDYKCNTYCTATYYGCVGYHEGGSYWCSGYYPDYKWNLDVHYNQATCCYKNMLDDCNKLQCNVGYVTDNSGWSVGVYVETDSTPCIQ